MYDIGALTQVMTIAEIQCKFSAAECLFGYCTTLLFQHNVERLSQSLP